MSESLSSFDNLHVFRQFRLGYSSDSVDILKPHLNNLNLLIPSQNHCQKFNCFHGRQILINCTDDDKVCKRVIDF